MNTNRKNIVLIASVMIVVALLTIYWRFFHPQPFPIVESAFIAATNADGIASPNGDFIYTGFHIKVNLKDGSESNNELAYQFNLHPFRTFLDLSPNGRYLVGGGFISDKPIHYLLDMEGKTYQEGSHLCQSWSGDSSRCLDIHFNLAEMPGNETIEEWNRNDDFRSLSNVSGDDIFLWDMDKRIPAAEILNKNDDNDGKSVLSLASLSYDGRSSPYMNRKDATVIPLLEIQSPREVASYIFDPTGRYVLFAIWEHSGEYVKGKYDTSTVADTVLILVDWRTKKSKEIFRMSTIDPENVAIARGSSALEWSSDGSTILVWRPYSPAVVLKVKYP